MKNLSKAKFTEYLQDEFWLLFGLVILFIFFLTFPFIYSILYFEEPAIGIQIILNGIVISVLYATLALGFSLIYGVAKQLKLSLGGYYVIAAYSMYFLLEARQIVPGSVPLIVESEINIDGLILLGLFLLPLLGIVIIIIFFWTVFEKREFFLLLISPIIAGGGFIIVSLVLRGTSGLLIQTLLEGLYISLAVLVLTLAAWYLELPKREIAVGVGILGVLVPLSMVLIKLNVVYLALMTVAVMVTACLAMLSDRFLIDKIRHSHINVMIVTFAVALFVQNFIQIVYFPFEGRELLKFGPEDRTLHGIIPLNDMLVVDLSFFWHGIGKAHISWLRIISVLFCIVTLVLLYVFIWFTRMGKALRAVSQDEEAAALAGIDIRKVTAIVSGVGMGIIGFAAVLTSSFSANPQWSPYMGWWVLISCIAVVTLGGMGSLPGTTLAAFIIGFSEAITGSMTMNVWPGVIDVPFNSFSPIIPFAAILLVLIFKPEGLLGTKEELE
ncbi:MAG: branched-chain amino acid ABC transporter permease [Candidatus Heimdallarchaeota archaeon]|nr:MAG: branched-chain amino acid ABC transporter permease [Candidatus Heimdallarchaeota archaeon]